MNLNMDTHNNQYYRDAIKRTLNDSIDQNDKNCNHHISKNYPQLKYSNT